MRMFLVGNAPENISKSASLKSSVICIGMFSIEHVSKVSVSLKFSVTCIEDVLS